MEDMTLKEFGEFANIELTRIYNTLAIKSAEYARGDAFSNIRGVAAIMECSCPIAVRGLMAKHLISINQFLNDLTDGKTQPNDRWREKIGDTIVYLLILLALVMEKEEAPIKATENYNVPMLGSK